MCVVVTVDLGCCKGCRERICRNLMRLKGVQKVEVKEDGSCIVVCGDGLNEAEILRQVKKRKGSSGVEVVAQLPCHKKLPFVDNSLHQTSSHGDLSEPNCRPLPPLAPDGGGVPRAGGAPLEAADAMGPFDTRVSMKGETLVTERMHKEFEGIKIRTRVTTSRDVCTCIRVEETRFIIDKQHLFTTIPCTEVAFDAISLVEAHWVSSCQTSG
ncbi:hypothetical protein L7F22_068664 [Adiantum nelumboides]|nr:hypothetical protein [Adiantum nelumboides]